MHTHYFFRSILFFLVLTGLYLYPASAFSDSEPVATSQATWSEGNSSGTGNFQSYCASCHGPEGKGDGMLADILDVKPRNLSDGADIGKKSDAHLFKVIKHGGISVGLSENMTPFNTQMSDKEIKNVIKYVRKDICKCSYKAP